MKVLDRNYDGLQSLQFELDIKKSRFIARFGYAETKAQAMGVLNTYRLAQSDARHHCWAYIIDNGNSAAASDDGEPSGTAGRPILNVLQHAELNNVILVVSRYFGGIKLGASGLIRAYSRAASGLLVKAPCIDVMPEFEVQLCCDFSQEQAVRYQVKRVGASIKNVVYCDQVQLLISIEEQCWVQLHSALRPINVGYSIVTSRSG